MEERTEQELDNRRRKKEIANLLVLSRPAKSTQNSTQKGKSGLSATEIAVGKYARAAFAKRKRNRAVSPKHQIMREERVKVGESRTLARKRGIKAAP